MEKTIITLLTEVIEVIKEQDNVLELNEVIDLIVWTTQLRKEAEYNEDDMKFVFLSSLYSLSKELNKLNSNLSNEIQTYIKEEIDSIQ